jgi:hypothetical protein
MTTWRRTLLLPSFAGWGWSKFRLEKFDMPTQWRANFWEVTLTGGGKTVPLATAYPWWGSKSAAGLELEPVWVGVGTPTDFQGRDVRGKAVLIITFLTTSGHHAPLPEGGIAWIRDNTDAFFATTALTVNCEHVGQTQTYFIGPNLVGSTAVAARRWYMQGSDELKQIVTKAFRTFGVTTYSRPASGSGGELGELRDRAPGFHVLSDVFYHTDLDTPAVVPEAGIEATVRAYAKIIDEANKLDLNTLRGSAYPVTDPQLREPAGLK